MASSVSFGKRISSTPAFRYTCAVACTAAVIAFVLLISDILIIPNAGVLYLLVVIGSALWLGTGPAVVALIISVFATTVFYAPMDASLTVITVRMVVITAALVVGVIVARLARQQRERAAGLAVQVQSQYDELQAQHEELVDKDRELRESEQKFSIMFEKAAFSAALSRLPDGVLEDVNEAWVRTFGYARQEAVGKTTLELNINPNPELRARMTAELQERGYVRDQELALLTRSGERRALSVSIDIVDIGGQQHMLNTALDITERKRAEEAVQESSQQRQLALDAARMGWWRYDPVTQISSWDDRYKEMFGVTGNERPNEQILARIHPEDLPGVWAKVEEALDPVNPQPYSAEYRIYLPDGSMRWIEAHGLASFEGESESRKATDLVGTVADITERKSAEAERERLLAQVQQEKDRLSALINSITDEVWLADTDKKFTLANPSAIKEFGLAGATGDIDVEKLAASLEVLRPDGSLRPVEEAPPLRALRGEVVRSQEEMVRTPATGELRYRQVSAAPLRDADGSIVGSVSVVRDITEHKRMEEALRRNEEQLRLATLAAGIGTWSWKPGTSHVVVSANWRKLFGVGADTEVTFETWGNALHPEDRDRAAHELNAAAEQHLEFNTEYRVVRPDGNVRWIVDRGHAFYDEGGQAVSMAGVNVDITERKETEAERERLLQRVQTQNEELPAQSEEIQTNNEELRVANEELQVINEELALATMTAQDAVRERDEFLSVAAHELKTPVTSLRGYAQVVMRQMDKTGDVDHQRLQVALGQLDRQSVRLTNLVNQLLDLSRLEAGKLVLEREEADVSALVEGVIATARRIYPLRTFALDEEGPLTAQVDALRLEQVITNLLDNAVKFSPKDTPIEVAVGPEDGRDVRISVRDHGPGIPATDCERIFERFYQAHGKEWHGGMGLGLFISKQIVELHGGSIEVECPSPGGACFTVVLPGGEEKGDKHDG